MKSCYVLLALASGDWGEEDCAYSGAGCDDSSSDLTAGALEGNSSSESSSSNSSSRLTLGFSATAGLGASSMETSWVSGSDLMLSICDAVLDDSSADVASGVIECGMSAMSFGPAWSCIDLTVLET
jgi:hypothetical protein